MKIVSIILGTILFFSCSSQAQSGNEKKVIGPKAFKAEMQAEESYYLLDVRTPAEYNAGNIEGARNLNIYDENFQAELAKLDKEKPVFVYCAVGGRSGQAAKTLSEMGFKKVVDLKGGYNAWKSSKP